MKQSKTGPSAIPRPSSAGSSSTLNTNGTKQQSSTSSPPASEKGAKGVPASNNTAATNDTENTKAGTSERSKSDASNGSESVNSGSGAQEAEDVKNVESDTNVGREQDSSVSDVDLKKKKSNGEAVAGEQAKESLPKSEDEGAWFAKKLDSGEEKAAAQGLSTTDPKEDGVSYADKIKEAGVEG